MEINFEYMVGASAVSIIYEEPTRLRLEAFQAIVIEFIDGPTTLKPDGAKSVKNLLRRLTAKSGIPIRLTDQETRTLLIVACHAAHKQMDLGREIASFFELISVLGTFAVVPVMGCPLPPANEVFVFQDPSEESLEAYNILRDWNHTFGSAELLFSQAYLLGIDLKLNLLLVPDIRGPLADLAKDLKESTRFVRETMDRIDQTLKTNRVPPKQ